MTLRLRTTLRRLAANTAVPAALFLSAGTLVAQNAPVTLTLGSDKDAKPVSPLFAGLSMETEKILPEPDGSHYFSPKNAALVSTFKQLGLRHLRIGGNTVDDDLTPPSEADIDELFAFAKAAGVKVSYSVRLKNNADPKESARIAKYIHDRYPDLSAGITIGNEVNNFFRGKDGLKNYLATVKTHIDAMRAAAPGLIVNGPGVCVDAAGRRSGYSIAGEAGWLLKFNEAFHDTVKIGYIGSHAYFGGAAYNRTGKAVLEWNPAELRAEMLSPAWIGKYERMYQSFGPELAKTGTPYRVDETNTYYIGGAKGASNSMAAAVWSLDYLYWWASHGAQGINFHNGTTLPFSKGSLPDGATRKPCYYASFWGVPGGYSVQAVGYGIKAFDLGGHGSLLPVTLSSPEKTNITAYATRADDGGVYLTVINKEIGTAARRVLIAQPKDSRFGRAESMSLEVKNHDAAATEGFTLGGAAISHDGAWEGKWIPASTDGEAITLLVPNTSAVVLHLSR